MVAQQPTNYSSHWKQRRTIILVELGREAARAVHRPRWVVSAGVAILLAYACVCHRQIETWRDGVTLFTRAVEIDETNWLAQLGLGMALTERGRFDEALPHLRRAAELPGNQAEARRKLAVCLRAQSGQ
jgi:tetratricopeptide (TPR) repeat protein